MFTRGYSPIIILLVWSQKNPGPWGQERAIIGGLNRLHQRGKAPQPTNVEGMNIRRSSIPAKLGVIPQKDRNFERPFTKKYMSIFWKNPGSYFENHLKRILGSQVTTPTVFKRRWSIGDWKKWHQWFSARRLDTSRYLHSPTSLEGYDHSDHRNGDDSWWFFRWFEQPILCWCHEISPKKWCFTWCQRFIRIHDDGNDKEGPTMMTVKNDRWW